MHYVFKCRQHQQGAPRLENVGKTLCFQDHPAIILFHKFKFNFHMFTWLKMKGNQKNILKIYDRKRVEISLVFSIAINLWTELFNSRTFNGLQFHFSRSSIWTNGWSFGISITYTRNIWKMNGLAYCFLCVKVFRENNAKSETTA